MNRVHLSERMKRWVRRPVGPPLLLLLTTRNPIIRSTLLDGLTWQVCHDYGAGGVPLAPKKCERNFHECNRRALLCHFPCRYCASCWLYIVRSCRCSLWICIADDVSLHSAAPAGLVLLWRSLALRHQWFVRDDWLSVSQFVQLKRFYEFFIDM